MSLTKSQIKFIDDNFFEFSFDDREPSFEEFQKLKSPEELHYLASIYNWDDGTEVLDWVIDSEYCSQATALFIFWRAEPGFFTRFNTPEEAEYEAEVWKLVKKIINKYEQGVFPHFGIGFDPKDDGADVDFIYDGAKWQLPEVMKKPVPGEKL